jgi:hypothetical protein
MRVAGAMAKTTDSPNDFLQAAPLLLAACGAFGLIDRGNNAVFDQKAADAVMSGVNGL